MLLLLVPFRSAKVVQFKRNTKGKLVFLSISNRICGTEMITNDIKSRSMSAPCLGPNSNVLTQTITVQPRLATMNVTNVYQVFIGLVF